MRGVFIVNTYFENKLIQRYTWKWDGRGNKQKALIDCVVVDERRKERCDAKTVRGMWLNLDSYMVIARQIFQSFYSVLYVYKLWFWYIIKDSYRLMRALFVCSQCET